MTTAESKTQKKSVKNSERNAFKVGESVEFEGKLAKVIAFGYLEQTSLPGEDASFSKELEAHLQLPAETPGGKPDIARHVPAGEITSLKDNPTKLRALQVEYSPLFGEPAPAEPVKDEKGPVIRKPGTITKAEAPEPATPRRAETAPKAAKAKGQK